MDNDPPKLPRPPMPAKVQPILPPSHFRRAQNRRAQRSQFFKPSCTHITMARLYDPYVVSFDLLGASFAKNLSMRPRGPENRSDKLSFFSEITQEQLRSYTPDQIRTILAQREHVLEVATKSSALTAPPPGFEHLNNTKPWVPSEFEECQFKCCPRCRPSVVSRTYLGIDEIVKGDIPPSAAVGFGFSRAGRPVIHPDRLENIGLRAVPWPRAYVSTTISSLSSLTLSSLPSVDSMYSQDQQDNEVEHAEYADHQPSRNGSIGKFAAMGGHSLSGNIQPSWSHVSEPSNYNLLVACLTPLPPPGPEELATLRKCPSKMMDEEMEEGRFHKEPLEVDRGVAFSEEGVGFGVPDVVTQA
ncbi:hypothetical protein F4804DRAFT_329484 [Jackrogersella minutella]|nr:hypothetical protein F4804DRAFT_329484 [Jackrogersella minutella]